MYLAEVMHVPGNWLLEESSYVNLMVRVILTSRSND